MTSAKYAELKFGDFVSACVRCTGDMNIMLRKHHTIGIGKLRKIIQYMPMAFGTLALVLRNLIIS